MAIIKCPECGHQVSDKAPICPSCGVEILNKVTRCIQCGEVYFMEHPRCPNCHHTTVKPVEHSTAATQKDIDRSTNNDSAVVSSATVGDKSREPSSPLSTPVEHPAGKSSKAPAIIVSCLITCLIVVISFYLYHDKNQKKALQAYEYALTSDDPLVLQSFLDNYPDASEAHIRRITTRLGELKRMDNEWRNVSVSNSKTEFLEYLSKYPGSKYKSEAFRKIDSLDWAFASSANTLAAYTQYLKEHVNGEYADSANNYIREIKATIVTPEEQERIVVALRNFFQSINSRDENRLVNSISEYLSSFLGKVNATKADVVSFLTRIYKEDIINMNWRLSNDYKIEKKEIGDEEYEYSIVVSAIQEIERTDPSKENLIQYKISAKINPDGKITEMNMTKILE
ncbi:MAG: zinc ribbon domain-containing protein [Prevotella sp.]|nr:zinc ribbon domain-containing protein [Prevotella sp.]